MQCSYRVAIVGATGLVGRTLLKVLEEKNFKNVTFILFSSEKSAGSKITFLNKEFFVYQLKESSFDLNFDYAVFCAGSNVSKKFIPIAVSSGTVVIDNSSLFRMNKDVPLIVPEVNIKDIDSNSGIIANPNCSTIQAVVPLKPLDDAFSIKRIIYSTYQAVSGAGKYGLEDLINKNTKNNLKKFPYPIFNNCLPHIDTFLNNSYTKEEYKMIDETRKILKKPNLPITATAVRIPVTNCHSESINIEFEKSFDLDNVFNLLKNSPGVTVYDDPSKNEYPFPEFVNGSDNVFVGRIRRDFSVKNGLNIWTVGDNLRKGAATNAVQILEHLMKNY